MQKVRPGKLSGRTFLCMNMFLWLVDSRAYFTMNFSTFTPAVVFTLAIYMPGANPDTS